MFIQHIAYINNGAIWRMTLQHWMAGMGVGVRGHHRANKKGATGSDGGRATPITWYSTPTDVPKFPPPPEAESLLAFRRPSEAAAKF